MERINSFVDFRTELVKQSTKKDDADIAQESSSKRARDELEQEIAKKQSGFAAALAVLKPERLKVDKAWNE
nr:hypothetical protein [Tanacetum cinerariifolium]